MVSGPRSGRELLRSAANDRRMHKRGREESQGTGLAAVAPLPLAQFDLLVEFFDPLGRHWCGRVGVVGCQLSRSFELSLRPFVLLDTAVGFIARCFECVPVFEQRAMKPTAVSSSTNGRRLSSNERESWQPTTPTRPHQ